MKSQPEHITKYLPRVHELTVRVVVSGENELHNPEWLKTVADNARAAVCDCLPAGSFVSAPRVTLIQFDGNRATASNA